jgi:hypothetical protein
MARNRDLTEIYARALLAPALHRHVVVVLVHRGADLGVGPVVVIVQVPGGILPPPASQRAGDNILRVRVKIMNGIDHNQNRLRFTYVFIFSQSHYLHPHPYVMCDMPFHVGRGDRTHVCSGILVSRRSKRCMASSSATQRPLPTHAARWRCPRPLRLNIS